MKSLKTTLFYSIALIVGVACSILFLSSFKTGGGHIYEPTTHTLIIEGMKFNPEKIQVRKGDIVEWINKDIVPHDVTEINKAWTSGPLRPKQEWSKKFTKTTPYYCSIHVVMKGTVVVEK